MFQWYIFAMFGMAIPRSMVINMGPFYQGGHPLMNSFKVKPEKKGYRWYGTNSPKKQVPNVLHEKCWDFFFKVQRTTSPATLLKQTKKSIQNPQILITPPRPVAQKGNTFFVFPRHWESTCWIHFELVSLHLQRCALFFVGRNLAVLGRISSHTLIETNRSSAVLRKTKLGANYNNVLPQFVFQRKKVLVFQKTPTASFVPSSQSPGGFSPGHSGSDPQLCISPPKPKKCPNFQ